MAEYTYFSKEGLEKLKAELKHLITVERPAMSKQIQEAREKGDLSENAEYDAAKEAQGLLEKRIAEMQAQLATARVVDESQMDNSKVMILAYVEIKIISNNAQMTYQIVTEKEANLKEKKISTTSPIGESLMGKKVGDIVKVKTPNGIMELEVLNISR